MNRLSACYVSHDDIDIRDTTMYLMEFILTMDRTAFEKADVVEGIQKVGIKEMDEL